MPFEDEDPPFAEPDGELDAIARIVIDASYAVYRALGPGLDEAIYEAALCQELKSRAITFKCQVIYDVQYKGMSIGQRRVDLLVADRLIVEIKAVEILSPLHKAQLLTYLKLARLKLGLLINFNTALLKDGIKRVINPTGN